ncbi:phosphatidylserine/phosphatidylglycerophosphate/cardiolipin synthase-like enzyme [Rhizobium sp. BK313]|uniref:phospholipase D family nuclease n=1 Tax=Rhizobium sp. BK313 TaxID=2587081 RepID=UPI0010E26414|nr:phospholipase D family protein [Rhizobium sp. BK313]MBB3458722.1 phosphatidylserine/phosphatidylglycerophosphate/cardiolipin synthase-like enzyme [Rhizobium sp. BK313]
MRFVIALLLVFANTQSVLATQPVAAKVSVCFTPSEQCEDRIVAEIDRARASIRVQAYGFTSLPIIQALQRAAGRGVEVLAILDKTNERKYSGATLLEAAGIPVWIDYMQSIAHNKIIVIDESLVIGGSYNYTAAAQRRNAENVTFIDGREVAREFLANWDSRLKASRAFEGPNSVSNKEAN